MTGTGMHVEDNMLYINILHTSPCPSLRTAKHVKADISEHYAPRYITTTSRQENEESAIQSTVGHITKDRTKTHTDFGHFLRMCVGRKMKRVPYKAL